jgi:hypothetical protein
MKGGPSKDWGSSSHGHIGNGIDFSFEELSEGGAKLAVGLPSDWGSGGHGQL